MPIAPLMHRFVEDELSRAAELIARTQAGALQLLRDTSGLSGDERAAQAELAESLQRHAARFQGEFVDALRARVAEERDAARSASLGSGNELDTLELMDESRVEADIEISRATQLIDTTAEWELRELQTFTSTLSGQTHVSAESNPLRPLVYASALWQACGVVVTDTARRALLLRIAAGVLAGLLKSAWAAACTRLESQGVEPGIYRTVLLTPANTPQAAPDFDVTRPGAFGNLLAGMPVGGEMTGIVATATPEFRAAAGAPGLHERQVVELLSRLFGRVQADPQVPGAFRALLGRLQPAALRLALKDAGLLDSHEHALWQLIDRIGSASAAWPQPGDPRAAALLVACDHAVEQITQVADPDTAAFKRALARIDAFLADQLVAQLRQAQPAIDTLVLAERRERLEANLSQRLSEQMAPVRTSPAVRRFVTGAWAKVLAEALQRFGEQGEPTRQYLKTVDDLLWSVQIPDHPQSRQRLLSLLPGLLSRLREGMALVVMPQPEQQAVLDELMAIHTEALRPGHRSGPAALTPEQIVQRMRDEVIPDKPAHPPFADSLIDLSSIETVPAELLDGDVATTAGEASRRIDTLRPGEWRRLFVRGRWSRVQLLWRSEQGSYFLFAGETAGRPHSITRRALERLNVAALMLPLDAASVVQRAVDAMLREISLPA